MCYGGSKNGKSLGYRGTFAVSAENVTAQAVATNVAKQLGFQDVIKLISRQFSQRRLTSTPRWCPKRVSAAVPEQFQGGDVAATRQHDKLHSIVPQAHRCRSTMHKTVNEDKETVATRFAPVRPRNSSVAMLMTRRLADWPGHNLGTFQHAVNHAILGLIREITRKFP